MAVLNFINQYAQLINFVLLVAIIGFLFNLTQLSRVALEDKYQATISTKDKTISNLQEQLKAMDEHYKSQISILEHNLALFQHIASLPKNKQVEALKHEYQLKLKELKEKEKTVESVIAKRNIVREKKIYNDILASASKESTNPILEALISATKDVTISLIRDTLVLK